MKIGELSRRSALSIYTLRYYEKIGLLPRADRDASGQRAYDQSILVWIAFIGRLKATGMPLREMVRYARLRERGETTVPERQGLLEKHRLKVRADMRELRDCLVLLDRKIAAYAAQKGKLTDDKPDPRKRKVPARP